MDVTSDFHHAAFYISVLQVLLGEIGRWLSFTTQIWSNLSFCPRRAIRKEKCVDVHVFVVFVDFCSFIFVLFLLLMLLLSVSLSVSLSLLLSSSQCGLEIITYHDIPPPTTLDQLTTLSDHMCESSSLLLLLLLFSLTWKRDSVIKVNEGKWHNVAITAKGEVKMSIYMDGQLISDDFTPPALGNIY